MDSNGVIRNVTRETLPTILSEKPCYESWNWLCSALGRNPSNDEGLPILILDTVLVEEGSLGGWWLTNRDGLVVKKTGKHVVPKRILPDFMRKSLEDPMNRDEFVAVAFSTHNTPMMLKADDLKALFSELPAHITSIQNYATPKGGSSDYFANFRHDFSVQPDGRPQSKSFKLCMPKNSYQYTSGIGKYVADTQVVPSMDSSINRGLDEITRLIVRHVESARKCRVSKITLEFLLDTSGDLFLSRAIGPVAVIYPKPRGGPAHSSSLSNAPGSRMAFVQAKSYIERPGTGEPEGFVGVSVGGYGGPSASVERAARRRELQAPPPDEDKVDQILSQSTRGAGKRARRSGRSRTQPDVGRGSGGEAGEGGSDTDPGQEQGPGVGPGHASEGEEEGALGDDRSRSGVRSKRGKRAEPRRMGRQRLGSDARRIAQAAPSVESLDMMLRSSASTSLLGSSQTPGCCGDFCSFDMGFSEEAEDAAIVQARKTLNEDEMGVLMKKLGQDTKGGGGKAKTGVPALCNVPFRSIGQARSEHVLVGLLIRRRQQGQTGDYLTASTVGGALAEHFPAHYYRQVKVCEACFKMYHLIDEERAKSLRKLDKRKQRAKEAARAERRRRRHSPSPSPSRSPTKAIEGPPMTQDVGGGTSAPTPAHTLGSGGVGGGGGGGLGSTVEGMDEATIEALRAAQEAVDGLTKSDVSEMRSLANPPAAVIMVASVLCILLTGRVLSWPEARRLMSNGERFLSLLVDFEPQSITKAQMRLLQPYLRNPLYHPTSVAPVSRCASRFCMWTLGVVRAKAWGAGWVQSQQQQQQQQQPGSTLGSSLGSSGSLPSATSGGQGRVPSPSFADKLNARRLEAGGADKGSAASISRPDPLDLFTSDPERFGGSPNPAASATSTVSILKRKKRSKQEQQLKKKQQQFGSVKEASLALARSRGGVSKKERSLSPTAVSFLRGDSLSVGTKRGTVSPTHTSGQTMSSTGSPREGQSQGRSTAKMSRKERAMAKTVQDKHMLRLSVGGGDGDGKGEGLLERGRARSFTCADGVSTLPYEVVGKLRTEIAAVNFIVVHDVFDTMDTTGILLRQVTQKHFGCQALVFNLPGQASAPVAPDNTPTSPVLTNEWFADRMLELLTHLHNSAEFLCGSYPFHLLGYGNGANIATAFALRHGKLPLFTRTLRSLVSVNGFAAVDSQLAGVLHSSVNVFSCFPPNRPDLPVSYFTRFLFCEEYLQRVGPNLALNMYTAVSNPITLEGRIRLCKGALMNSDYRSRLRELHIPLLLVQSTENVLVNAANVDPFLEGRQVSHLWSHLVSDNGEQLSSAAHMQVLDTLNTPDSAFVIWLRAGHEVRQECRSLMLDLLHRLADPADGVQAPEHSLEPVFVPSADFIHRAAGGGKDGLGLSLTDGQETLGTLGSGGGVDGDGLMAPVPAEEEKGGTSGTDGEEGEDGKKKKKKKKEKEKKTKTKTKGLKKKGGKKKGDKGAVVDTGPVPELPPIIVGSSGAAEAAAAAVAAAESATGSGEELGLGSARDSAHEDVDDDGMTGAGLAKAAREQSRVLWEEAVAEGDENDTDDDEEEDDEEDDDEEEDEDEEEEEEEEEEGGKEDEGARAARLEASEMAYKTAMEEHKRQQRAEAAKRKSAAKKKIRKEDKGRGSGDEGGGKEEGEGGAELGEDDEGALVGAAGTSLSRRGKKSSKARGRSKTKRKAKGTRSGKSTSPVGSESEPDVSAELTKELEVQREANAARALAKEAAAAKTEDDLLALQAQLRSEQEARFKQWEEEDRKRMEVLEAELRARRAGRVADSEHREAELAGMEAKLVESGVVPPPATSTGEDKAAAKASDEGGEGEGVEESKSSMEPTPALKSAKRPMEEEKTVELDGIFDNMSGSEDKHREEAVSRIEALNRAQETMAVEAQARATELAEDEAREREALMADMAVKVQRTFRGYRGRKYAAQRRVQKEIHDERAEAAVMIQTVGRGYLARRLYRDMKAREVEETLHGTAAQDIQRVWRGSQGRKRVRAIRAERATRLIQRVYRGHGGRTIVRAKRAHMALLQKQYTCAGKIQATWKMFIGRQHYNALRVETLAAVEIQRVYRGSLGRRRAKRTRDWQNAEPGPERLELGLRLIDESKMAFERQQEEIDALHRAQEKAELRVSQIHSGLQESEQELAVLERELQEIDQIERDLRELTHEKELLRAGVQGAAGMPSTGQVKGVPSDPETDSKLLQAAGVGGANTGGAKPGGSGVGGFAVMETKEEARKRQAEAYALEMAIHLKRAEREKKKKELESEFAAVFSEVERKKEALSRLESAIADMEATRVRKDREFSRLQRNLMELLQEQKSELDMLRDKGIELETATATSAAAAVATAQRAKEHEKQSTAMFQSTEELMKFQFMAMSLSYFSSLNMLKNLRDMNSETTTAAVASAADTAAAAASAAAAANIPSMKSFKLGADEILSASQRQKQIRAAEEKKRAEEAAAALKEAFPEEVRLWTVEDVLRWLDTLSLSQYKRAFKEAEVDGAFLLELREEDMMDVLGMEHKLHVRKVVLSRDKLKPLSEQEFRKKQVVLHEEQSTAAREGKAVPDADTVFSQARNGRFKRLEESLNLGFEVNTEDEKGNTLLCVASQNVNKRIVEMLLDRGAKINHKNAQGNTPLHFSMAYDTDGSLGEFLIERGADDTIENKFGLTPYDGISAD